MNKRRIGLLLAALLALTSLLAACGGAQSPTEKVDPKPTAEAPKANPGQTTYPITIKDAAGRDITIQAEPKRIVSVAPSNTELLFALGKGSSLVGRSDFDDYPAEAAQIESVGGFFPPNYEKIISLNPDLVLVIGGSEEARTKLEQEYKLTTFVVDPQNFAQLYEGIKVLGQVVNAQEQAAKLVAQMQADVKAIADKAATAANKPVVYYEVWHDPLMSAGPNTFIDDMIRLAGGLNAAGDVKDRWPTLAPEQLFAANPGVIITASADAAKSVQERKGWESLKAVKEGKVLGLPDENLAVRPGPRLVQGLKLFAEAIHPELFAK